MKTRALLLPLCALAAFAAEPNPWIGAWILVPAKSTFTNTPAPQKAAIVITEDGFKYEAVNADGTSVSFSVSRDSETKEVPVTGIGEGVTCQSKVLDEWTREGIYKYNGEVVLTVRSVLSKDGRTITATSKGVNQKGEPTGSVALYRKARN